MNDDTTFWMNLPVTQREKIREEIQRKEYKACIRELTSIPLTQQVQAENAYLRSENQVFHSRISRNDTFLYPIPPDNFRVLYKYALALTVEQRSWMTMLSFEALEMAAKSYAENPPQQKRNQMPLEAEQMLIDMAMENILWGTPHLQYAMWNIGFDNLKTSQVYSTLKRNNIPTTLRRRTKGIDWTSFLACMDILLEDESDPEPQIRMKPSADLPKNPYRRWHKRLIKFYRNATIDPEDMALNKFLRVENMILSGIYFRNHKELQLNREEKVALAKTASKIRGPNRDKMPLLTPAEVVRYARKQASKRNGHKSPKRDTTTTETDDKPKFSYALLKEHILEFVAKKKAEENEEDRIYTRKSVWHECKTYFKREIGMRTINDLMYELDVLPPAKEKNKGIPWKEFKKRFAGVTWAGDFFSVYVWSRYGVLKYQIMFFVHLATGEVFIAGASNKADSEWVLSMIKSWTDAESPFGREAKFLIRDCDKRYTKEVDWYFTAIGLQPRRITPYAPVMNCQAETFVHHVKSECLNQFLIVSEKQLKKLLQYYQHYYNTQRPNSKMQGWCIQQNETHRQNSGAVRRESLLPGVLTYYCRDNSSDLIGNNQLFRSASQMNYTMPGARV